MTPAAQPPVRVSRWKRWRRGLLAMLLVSLALLLVLAVLIWGVRSESGTRMLWRVATAVSAGSLSVEQPSGRLWDDWGAARLTLRSPALQIDIQDLRVRWALPPMLRRQIVISELRADRAIVLTRPSDEAARLPLSLRLPVTVQITALQLGELQLGQLAADASKGDSNARTSIRDINASKLDMSDAIWRLERAQATTPWGTATASGEMAAEPPYALKLAATLEGKVESRVVSMQGEFGGTLSAIDAVLRAQGEGVSGQARVALTPFDALPIRSADIALSGINPAAFDPKAPQALLTLNAQLTPTRSVDAQGNTQWRIRGPLSMKNDKPAALDANGIALESASASIDWAQGVLSVNDLDIRVPDGGRAQGKLSWRADATSPSGQLEAALTLSNIASQRLVGALRPMRIAGQAKATVTAAVQRFDAQLSAAEGNLDIVGTVAQSRLVVDRVRLIARGTEAVASGSMQLSGTQAFSARGSVAKFNPRQWATTAPEGELNGQFTVNGVLKPQWSMQAEMRLPTGRLAGYALQGQARGLFSAQGVRDALVDMNVLGNQIKAQGDFGRVGDRLTLQLRAPQLDRLFSGYAGSIEADGVLTGSVAEPAGELEARISNLQLPGGAYLDTASAKLKLGAGADGALDAVAKISGLQLVAKNEALTVREMNIVAQGQRRQHSITIDARMANEQSFNARARGGVQPALAGWRGMLKSMNANGNIAFALQQPATLLASGERFELGSAELRTSTARLTLARTLWTPQRIEARGSMTGLRVGLSLDERQRTVARGRSLLLGGEWDFTVGATVNGNARVFRESGDVVVQGDAPVSLGLTDLQVLLAATDNRLALAASASGRRIGEISASATALAQRQGSGVGLNMDAPLLGAAHIEVPAVDWVGPLVEQNLRTGGKVVGDFSLSGTPAKPVSSGSITGEALEFGLADQGMHLYGGEMKLLFDADKLQVPLLRFLSRYEARPADPRVQAAALTREPGTLSLEGEIKLTTGEGRFAVQAERVGVMQRPDVWVLLSGKGEVRSTWDSAKVTADLRTDAAFVGFAKSGKPSLSDDVVVRGAKQDAARKVHIAADVGLDFGNRFLVKAYGVDAMLDGKLRVRRGMAGPDVAGSDRLLASGTLSTQNGTYDAYGQRLSIERGRVNFLGPLDNPGLNIVALRKGLAVEAGVEVTGTAQQPRVRLISDPNVPDSEKLSWMLLGRGTEVGTRDAGLLLSAASALLGSGGEGITERMARSLGLDNIGIANSDVGGGRPITSRVASAATGTGMGVGGEGAGGEQVLSVGKRLSNDAYISVEQNFLGTESLLKLTYTLTRYLSLAVRAGTDNAIDLSYSISFK